jgi:ABC-type Na+ efflux pump permease subunit
MARDRARFGITAWVIWLLLLGNAVRLGLAFSTGDSVAEHTWASSKWITFALPLLALASAPFWMQGHPLDFGPAKKSVNQMYGDGTYEAFCRSVRPVALLAATMLLIAAVCAGNARRVGAAEGAYVIAGYFLAAGLGFALCLAVLKLQGNTLE